MKPWTKDSVSAIDRMRLNEALLQMYKVPKREEEKTQNNKPVEFFFTF